MIWYYYCTYEYYLFRLYHKTLRRKSLYLNLRLFATMYLLLVHNKRLDTK